MYLVSGNILVARKSCNSPVPILFLFWAFRNSCSCRSCCSSFFFSSGTSLQKNQASQTKYVVNYLHAIPLIPPFLDGAAAGGGGDMGPALILTEPASLRTVSARPTWSRSGVTMTCLWSAGGVTIRLCACSSSRGERQSSSSSTEVERKWDDISDWLRWNNMNLSDFKLI